MSFRATNTPADEYLTIAELAARLKVKPKTIRNKMAAGLFTEGIHYFRRPGLGARFKWSAVVQWIESGDTLHVEDGDSIPMSRGYALGGAVHTVDNDPKQCL